MLQPPGAKVPLLTNGTTTGSTNAVNSPGSNRTYQATAVASSGTGNAVVAVQGSMDGTFWDTIGTITLTSASTAGLSDSFSSQDRYPRIRANVTSLSSNVTAAAWMGY
jgi:hypothetical protein